MTGQEIADLLRERFHRNRYRDVTLESWEVDYIIAKLEAAEELAWAVQNVMNAELEVEPYMNHMNKYIGTEIDSLGEVATAYNNIDGEGKT